MVLVAPTASTAAHPEQPRLSSEEIKAYQKPKKIYIRQKCRSASMQTVYWHNRQRQMQQHENASKIHEEEEKKLEALGEKKVFFQLQYFGSKGV